MYFSCFGEDFEDTLAEKKSKAIHKQNSRFIGTRTSIQCRTRFQNLVYKNKEDKINKIKRSFPEIL